MTSPPETMRLPSHCGIVVLAGGTSTRMGIAKSELLIDDETTFLQRIVCLAAALTHNVCVVVRSGSTDHFQQRYAGCAGFERVVWAEDAIDNRGPMEGIHQGLKSLRQNQPVCELAFVTSCDVPQLNGALVHALLERVGNHDAVTPVAGKRIYGMTAVYRTRLWEQAREHVAAGRLRVSELVASNDSATADLESLKAVDPMLNSFENINLPEDYFRYLAKNDITCTKAMKQQFDIPTKP